MRTGVRIHISLFGVSEKGFERVRGKLEFLDEVEYGEGTLRIWREGLTADPEQFFEDLAGDAGLTGEGAMDVIDHDEWTLTRYTLKNGEVKSRTIPLNEALEGKSDEWGA